MEAAVIGAGRMGRRHIQVLQELGINIVGVADGSTEALTAAATERRLEASALFVDAAVLFARVKPRIVIVATTAPSHCDLVTLAAQNGAEYILCEKPLAVSLEECDRMISVCKSHGVKLAVNHQMRFMEQYCEPKRLLESEAFGGFSSALVLGGNFGVAMNGSHYIEMFRFLTDEVPTEVAAWFTPDILGNPRGPQFEDRAGSIRLVTANGKRLYIDASSDQGHGMTVMYAARNGHICVNELTGSFATSVREEQYRAMPTTRYGMPAHEEARTIAPADAIEPTKAVLRALLSGENFPTGEDGKLVVSVLVAAHVSNENRHRTVNLTSEQLPRDRRFSWA
jgi:predicted dehydrogenase